LVLACRAAPPDGKLAFYLIKQLKMRGLLDDLLFQKMNKRAKNERQSDQKAKDQQRKANSRVF
jgi:hypothetical protein